MPNDKRSALTENPVDIGTGPYLAKVVSHLDKEFTGGLEVTLLRSDGNIIGDGTQTYPVKYAPPFYGYTAFEFMGLNPDFNDTQKSYGMWFVPPDIGVTVLVVFIDGRADRGYWTNCIPARFTNNMVPGIAASENYVKDSESSNYDVDKLPVAEVNRRANDLTKSLQVDKIPKPVHPMVEYLLKEGLLDDDVRGVTSSSARRSAPNSVFGISTPGPLDRRPGSKKAFIGKSTSVSQKPVPVSRIGGSQFVMDDGNERYQRKTSPSEGPPDYADLLEKETGVPNSPKDELIRLRTRTGHQILLHTSEDLIYIGNSRGTTWIELTSDGKIDIFAEDSISVHTKQDMNFYANRDINLEAGRNVNIKASAEYSKGNPEDEKGAFYDASGFESGRVQIESAHNYNLLIGRNGKINLTNKDQVQGNLDIKVLGNMRISVQDKDDSPTHSNIDGESTLEEQPEGVKGFHIKSNENLVIEASKIDLNGPPAETADKILELKTYPTLVIDQENVEWKDTRYTSPDSFNSIMKRVPMHEPWPFHENKSPTLVKPEFTDREGSPE